MSGADVLSPFSLSTRVRGAVPLTLLGKDDLGAWLAHQDAATRRWVEQQGFKAVEHTFCFLPPTAAGGISGVLVGVGEEALSLWSLGDMPSKLPSSVIYRIANKVSATEIERLALGWAMGAYQFAPYHTKPLPERAVLAIPAAVNGARLAEVASAVQLVRNLINYPANDLGTEELAQVGVEIGKRYGAKATVIKGKKLEDGFPAVYAVGKGSKRPPLVLDMVWGDKDAPKVTLVGKGVVFDTGGYNIKPDSGMAQMKKDMGGAAHALALAQLVMATGQPVQVRVVIPLVENSISGSAFRPSDIIRTRAGKTVEIGNTDAEGRLILADALAYAAEDKPDWLIDFATLTGARNVALGTEIPCLFSNNDALAAGLFLSSQEEEDYIWRLPLWKPYRRFLKSKNADMNNISSAGANAGAITAALFLEQFVPKRQPWAHIDFNAYTPTAQPGRPEGGEAMALRACFSAIEKAFSEGQGDEEDLDGYDGA